MRKFAQAVQALFQEIHLIDIAIAFSITLLVWEILDPGEIAWAVVPYVRSLQALIP